MKQILVTLLVVVLLSPPAFGHDGGLNRDGCHTNRKTGEYHCHGGSATPAPSPAPGPTPASQRSVAPVMTLGATTADKDLVQAAQVLLRILGYEPSLLGELDERTRAAIRSFQRVENLSANGLVSEYLVLRLAQKVAPKCP